MMQFYVKKGFSGKREKDYFVAEVDGDTIDAVITGPFETQDQCYQAIEALKPFRYRKLVVISGHISGFKMQAIHN